LEREPPRRYAETHAGSAAYPILPDAERQFGIMRFLDVAASSEVLARCRYGAVAASWLDGHGLYPGSALLAMTMLGDAAPTCCATWTQAVPPILAAGPAN